MGSALERAAEAHERMEQTHELHGRGVTGRVKSLVEADLGLVEQARASAQHGLAAAQEMSDGYFVIASTGVLGVSSWRSATSTTRATIYVICPRSS